MSGDEREIKLKELGEKLGYAWGDYSVFSGNEHFPWCAWFSDSTLIGEGGTIAQAENDLIEKLEKYIDSGGSFEPAKDD